MLSKHKITERADVTEANFHSIVADLEDVLAARRATAAESKPAPVLKFGQKPKEK